MSVIHPLDSLETDDSSKSEFLGEGSYGCVYYPGITCKGKKNKNKTITKIQEINFYSDNEKTNGTYIKTHITNYKKYFSPVTKFCIVTFNTIEKSNLDIKKCDTLFDEYNSRANVNYGDESTLIYNTNPITNPTTNPITNPITNPTINNQYILMYSSYIEGYTIKDFYVKYKNQFVFNVLNSIYNTLYAISLLNHICIIYNDLHINNILINLKNFNPIIIDFGLSFNISNCYKLNKDYIDFQYLKKFTFDYREDSYHFNIEKRFISFIIFNRTENFTSNVFDNNDNNNLVEEAINFFIADSYDTLHNNEEISNYFDTNEFVDYKKALTEFYYQFLDKNEYPKYNTIVKYLLNFVYMYNDLYSLTINLLYLSYLKEYKKTQSLNSEEQVILEFFIQLYKKSLYPHPNMRLNILEVLHLYRFIIKFIKSYNLKTVKNSIKIDFITALVKFLKSENISIKIVFYKSFAFLNFNLLCTDLIFQTIKASPIKL